jgi:hypothetical protein
VRLDRQLLGPSLERQGQVQARALPDPEGHALRARREARRLGGHLVVARAETDRLVGPVRGRGHAAGQLRSHVGEGHGGPRNRRSRGIANDPGERRTVHLGRGARGEGQDDQEGQGFVHDSELPGIGTRNRLSTTPS